MTTSSRNPAGAVERLPLDAASPWWGEHRSRYRFARGMIPAGLVLDIASGSGYGAEMLAGDGHGSRFVVACDASIDAALAARRLVPLPTVRFVPCDGRRLPFADSVFDAVVSFETVEHIAEADRFVGELRRVLKRSGVLVLSTPNASVTSAYPANPFHVKEFTPAELGELLGPYFGRVELRGQRLSRPRHVAPFLPGYDRARSTLDHARLVAWKVGRRLPAPVRETLSEVLLGRSFYPGESEFAFTPDHTGAHVLLAICHP